MIHQNAWKEEANDAITAARRADTITWAEAAHLRRSLEEPISEVCMNKDTARRLAQGPGGDK